jgi:hypothetical protein
MIRFARIMLVTWWTVDTLPAAAPHSGITAVGTHFKLGAGTLQIHRSKPHRQIDLEHCVPRWLAQSSRSYWNIFFVVCRYNIYPMITIIAVCS